jgi:hypothetical protein
MAAQSSDCVYPKRFMAVELAQSPKGYNFHLGPVNDGVMVFMTDIHME